MERPGQMRLVLLQDFLNDIWLQKDLAWCLARCVGDFGSLEDVLDVQPGAQLQRFGCLGPDMMRCPVQPLRLQ